VNGAGDVLLQLDIVDFVTNKCSNPSDADALMQELVFWMIPIQLTQERFDYFKNDVLLDQLPAAMWTSEWNLYLSTSDDMNVRTQLERVVLAIMQSPEYQLF
jgi:hypothetical protein